MRALHQSADVARNCRALSTGRASSHEYPPGIIDGPYRGGGSAGKIWRRQPESHAGRCRSCRPRNGFKNCTAALTKFGISGELLLAAGLMKRVTGQVNVLIHAMGILACLPRLLEAVETVEYVSLGAGNTGRSFDLETSHRVAEFKFIRWRGGPESIRQNQLFKDFYLLARSKTHKQKCLYVLGTEYPLKFFNSRRALSSVLSRHDKVAKLFRSDFGEHYEVVRDYYHDHKDIVKIEDVSSYVPDLIADEIAESD